MITERKVLTLDSTPRIQWNPHGLGLLRQWGWKGIPKLAVANVSPSPT